MVLTKAESKLVKYYYVPKKLLLQFCCAYKLGVYKLQVLLEALKIIHLRKEANF